MSYHKLVAAVLLVSAYLCLPSVAHALQMAPPATPKKKLTVHEIQRSNLKTRMEGFHREKKKLKLDIAEKQRQLDSINISAAAFEEVVTTLQTKRINLMIELAGLDARVKQAEKVFEQNSRNDAQNGIHQMLQKLVDNAKANVVGVEKLYSNGRKTGLELAEAKKLLLEAQLKLAQLKTESSRGVNAQPLSQMLVEASLAKTERTAQLKLVNELLKNYAGEARLIISSLDDDQQNYEFYTELIREDASELKELEDQIMRDEMQAEF